MTTFTRRIEAFDETTGLSTETTSTISGKAVQVRGLPATYRALSLVESQNPTLLFTPSVYGLEPQTDAFVRPGDEVVWGTQTYTVKDVAPVAPDGFGVLVARIIIGR